MELRFGGCFRQDPPMKRLPNFIDAQSATTLGVTTPSQPHTHTHTHTTLSPLPFSTILFSLQFRSGFLAELVEVVLCGGR
jgi:hypothetical protein